MLDLDLDFFDSSSKYGVIKATVHKTGKLGFSSGASKMMNLEEVKFFNIGLNRAVEEDKSLYIVPIEKENDKAFKLVKAGEYYYIFIKNILRELKIDYKSESVIYDIDEISSNNTVYYKLTRRKGK